MQGELQHQEQSMASSRREREKVISEYRSKANERKEFQEKVERRVNKTANKLKRVFQIKFSPLLLIAEKNISGSLYQPK